MSFNSVSNRFRLAAFVVIAAFGFSTSPAEAQVPTITNCFVPASGGNIVHTCAAVSVEVQVIGIPNGGCFPFTCGFKTFYQMRAKRNPVGPFGRVVSAQARPMSPFTTCNLTPTTTAWTPWCTIANTVGPQPTIWMTSVVAPVL